jgi:hypothetical protein
MSETMKQMGERARFLMRANVSRDGYSLTIGGLSERAWLERAQAERKEREGEWREAPAPLQRDERGHPVAHDPKRADRVLRRIG